MSIKQIFGTPIYICNFSGHDKCAETFEQWIANDNIFHNPWSFFCNIDTTIQNAHGNSELPWNDFIEPAIHDLNEYLKYFDVQGPLRFTVSAWLNRYKKGYSQEVHHHVQTDIVFSCAYMLKLPKDGGQFSFVSNNSYGNSFAYTGFNNLCGPKFPMSDKYTPELKQGDIIFFPSDAYHMVGPNNTDEVRATISANFGVSR